MSTTIEIKEEGYTYADYQNTPDDQRFELIGGELLMSPAPFPRHQRILYKLAMILGPFIEDRKLGLIYFAPCDVYLDDHNVVQPDIFFIRQDRLHIIGEKNIQGPPNLVIEIVSEASANRDLVKKKKMYAPFHVPELWLLIQEAKAGEIYREEKGKYALIDPCAGERMLTTPQLPGLTIKIEELFS